MIQNRGLVLRCIIYLFFYLTRSVVLQQQADRLQLLSSAGVNVVKVGLFMIICGILGKS